MLACNPDSCKSLQRPCCDFVFIQVQNDFACTVEHESNDATCGIVVPSNAVFGFMKIRLCPMVKAWYPMSVMCIKVNLPAAAGS